MMTQRTFFNHFIIEVLFNVPEPFGKDSTEAVKEIADILRKGFVA